MKFFIAIALFAAVASAYILPANVNLTPAELAEIKEIMAAIHSPNTDPTTAILLEQMLHDLLGVSPVMPPNFPAIDDEYAPIHVGPAVVDFPIPDGALAPEDPAPAAPTSSPLVQIIVNVNDQSGAPSPVEVEHVEGPSPVVVVDKPKPSLIKPTPVQVVESWEPEPVQVRPVIVRPSTMN